MDNGYDPIMFHNSLVVLQFFYEGHGTNGAAEMRRSWKMACTVVENRRKMYGITRLFKSCKYIPISDKHHIFKRVNSPMPDSDISRALAYVKPKIQTTLSAQLKENKSGKQELVLGFIGKVAKKVQRHGSRAVEQRREAKMKYKKQITMEKKKTLRKNKL